MGFLKVVGWLALIVFGLIFLTALGSVMVDRSNGRTGTSDENDIQAKCQRTVDEAALGNERRTAQRMCDIMRERAAAGVYNK